MIPNAKIAFCYFNSSGGLFVGVYIREVFKMNDTEKLIHDLRLLGKYSTLEPNWLVVAADKIEELSSKQIKTNYDRIRNMSVEEMAEFIYNNVQEDETGLKFIGQDFVFSKEEVVQWLESEVQGE